MDLVRCLVPEDFKISLSCLYTYTMNYNQGTAQAKRRHHGSNVNAKISLHTAPSTGEIKRPVNAHWTTSNETFCVTSHIRTQTAISLIPKMLNVLLSATFLLC